MHWGTTMSHLNDLYAGRAKDIRERWFPTHVAEHRLIGTLDSGRREEMHWHKERTSIYGVRYALEHGTLVVTGDIGDAVYRGWGGVPLTLDWISGLDLHYFASKCTASEYGQGYRSWDSTYAMLAVKEVLKAMGTLHLFEELDDDGCLFNLDTWQFFLDKHGQLLFGDDYGEYGRIGQVVDIRCQGHLIGLQMAMVGVVNGGA